MDQREVSEMVSDSIAKLIDYNAKAKSRMDNLLYRENDIQTGRQLLLEINRGPLFEDADGRDPEYESLVGEEFEELRREIMKTANLVRFLKGDISLKVYEQKDDEIMSSFGG